MLQTVTDRGDLTNAPKRPLQSIAQAVSRVVRTILSLLTFAATIGLLSARSHAAEKIKVLTTFLPAYCVAANVAGSAAHVENLVPESTTPHDYQLTPSDVRRLNAAQVVVINGLGLENWLQKAFSSTAQNKRKIVELAVGLEKQLIAAEGEHDHAHGDDHHHHGHENPHTWLDPLLLAHGVTNVLNALVQADPQHGETYRQNARAYIDKLHALDKSIADQLAPVRARPFVTYHNAFPYFARRYHLQIAGVVQELPDVSPSPKYLANLSRDIRSKKVVAIFTETQSPGRIAARLAADLKLPTGQLSTLEGGALTPAAYEEGMRKNAETLARILSPHGK